MKNTSACPPLSQASRLCVYAIHLQYNVCFACLPQAGRLREHRAVNRGNCKDRKVAFNT